MVSFAPSLRNGFVDFDDYSITSNPAYQGLGLPQLRWMLTALVAGHWMPVTWLTLALDYMVWGLDPMGFHLTSLLLHAGNAVLLYLVARRLGQRATGRTDTRLSLAAASAALVFAVHPLRVESVAWASERRDVLSGFFFLMAIVTYLDAAAATAGRRRWLLAASSLAYVAALGSKSVVMTLPLVLVLLDVYPLRRLEGPIAGWFTSDRRAIWLEKLPYLVLSAGGAALSYYAHQRVMPPTEYSWPVRLAVSVHSLWFYIVRTVAPVWLSPVYELPRHLGPFVPQLLAAAFGVVAMTFTVLLLRRRWPAGLAVWAYYGITLAPVSGLVYNAVLAADRYSYLPSLGLALLVGAGLAQALEAADRSRRPGPARVAVAAGAVALALTLALMTWQQVGVWRDSGTLWAQATRATPDCFVCQTNRGVWLVEHGAPGAGLPHLERARTLRPRHPAPRLALVRAYLDLGAPVEARREYDALWSVDPTAARRLATLFGARERDGQAEVVVPGHGGGR
jgi:hypothetical protein